MTIALWCVLAASLMPFVLTGIAKVGHRAGIHVLNRKPRVFQAELEGYRARAHWAHLNSIEAFAPFAAAVLTAQMLHAPQAQVDGLALAFIALRVIYAVAYIRDQAILRSSVWVLALACVVALFVIAA